MKQTLIKAVLLILPFNFVLPLTVVITRNSSLDIVTALLISLLLSILASILYGIKLYNTDIKSETKLTWWFGLIFIPNLTQILYWYRFIR